MESVRERLQNIIKTLPDDKLITLLDFANRLIEETQAGSEDDELLMTK